MENTTIVRILKHLKKSSKLKKILFIFLVSAFSLAAYSNPKLASKEQIGMFKNSTTCVVLDNGGLMFNALLKDAVEKHWSSTKYEFISEKEFENRRFDSKYSFLVLMKGVFDKDPGGVVYDYLSLVLGGPARKLTDMPEICSIPLSYSFVDSDYYGYAIPAIIKFMQKHARNLESKRLFISLKGLKFYNGSRSFKGNALLLDKKMLAEDASTVRRIKSAYPYYIKLLDSEELQDELNLKPINTMFLFHVGPNEQSGSGKCFEMIFDIEGNLYYYNARKITNDNEDGFNLNDLKHLR